MANLFIFAYVASFYTYSDFPEEEDNDEEEDPHEEIKTGKKQDKMEPTPDEEIEPTPDEETEEIEPPDDEENLKRTVVVELV